MICNLPVPWFVGLCGLAVRGPTALLEQQISELFSTAKSFAGDFETLISCITVEYNKQDGEFSVLNLS